MLQCVGYSGKRVKIPYGHAAVMCKIAEILSDAANRKKAIGEIREGESRRTESKYPVTKASLYDCECRLVFTEEEIYLKEKSNMKKMTEAKKALSLLLCIVLIAAVALFSGCNAETNPPDTQTTTDSLKNKTEDVTVLGEGETKFTFTVTDLDGKESVFEINTDKTTVGEALLDVELIAGDEGEYGLYVKTVNGITLDYETDGAYWAFYVDGTYAMAGVDATDIAEGSSYLLKAEKA